MMHTDDALMQVLRRDHICDEAGNMQSTGHNVCLQQTKRSTPVVC